MGATREQKLRVLLQTMSFDEAMQIAPTLKDDVDGDPAADKAAEEAAAVARAESKNPFRRGEHFNMVEQGRLYKNPKTRDLAIRLAKAAGVKLPENPINSDINPRAGSSMG